MHRFSQLESNLHQRTASLKAQGIPLMTLQSDPGASPMASSTTSLNRQSFHSVREDVVVLQPFPV